jgi:hypothetical protein
MEEKIQGSYVHAKRQGTCTAQRFIECDPVNILYATSGLLVRYESVKLSSGLCFLSLTLIRVFFIF